MPTIAQDLAAALKAHHSGDVARAEAMYGKILRIDPQHVDALHLTGLIALQKQKPDVAADFISRALAAHGADAKLYTHLGAAFRASGRFDEAIEAYTQALRAEPRYAKAHYNLGIALAAQGRDKDSLAAYRSAIECEPGCAEAYNNAGLILVRLGRLEEAVSKFEQAVERAPHYPEAHMNLGNAYRDQLRLDEAIASYESALRLRDNSEIRLNRALLLLMRGDFKRGWPEYETCRTQRDGVPPGARSRPVWNGASLAGRTILLHSEQGLGDTLQFIRYAPLVKRVGGTVIVACQPALCGLLRGLAGIDEIVDVGGELPLFDVRASLLSLPGILGTDLENLPCDVPYLSVQKSLVARSRPRIREIAGFKIGIYWQGNPQHQRDRQRSIPLSRFLPLTRLDGVRCISLQQGPGTEQLQSISSDASIVDLGSGLDRDSRSFQELAAVMRQLDLVVTCDTAALHLAGGLGVPTWAAIPHLPDWRWLLEREDTPWYPTVRLFRQPAPEDWESVFDRMAHALEAHLASPLQYPL
jgi:tetratricopeptide (TPR) repeat protein